MKILLFTGAGASVELGIPGMRGMVEEFHANLRNLGLSDEVVGRFDEMLPQADYDMQNLIEHVESLERGQQSQRALGLETDNELLRTARAMRWEAEWFVQHACERLREVEAKTLWAPTLRRIGCHELCIATTNYDRSIEIACGCCKVPFDDGFEALSDVEVARWRGLEGVHAGSLRLLKVHGSTDWYRGDDESIYKLRHPMPLYGNLGLSFLDPEVPFDPRMTSSMILPTREKRTTQPPYPDLITDFRTFARQAELAIFVGTSLRDPDLYDVCRQCAQRGTPTYLVNVDASLNLPHVKMIVESASGFLASTLPRFLAGGDSELLDACSNGRFRTVGTDSILSSLVSALEGSGEPDAICGAIDRLVDCGAMLDLYDIRKLLTNQAVTVRKYALALIPQSVDHMEAMALAGDVAASDPDSSLGEELKMMEGLIEGLSV